MFEKKNLLSHVNQYKYSGIYMRICGYLGLLNIDDDQSITLIFIYTALLGCGIFHFGFGGYQKMDEWEFGETMEAFHFAIIKSTAFFVSLILTLARKSVRFLFLKLQDGLYQYPWGPWKEETVVRNEGEETVRGFCLAIPAVFLTGRLIEFIRHFWNQNRKPYEPFFKGWVPFTEDTIYTLIGMSIFHASTFLSFFLMSSCICTFFGIVCEKILIEVDVLKLVLKDPHFIVENHNVSFNEVIKSCIQHQNAIYKHFGLMRKVSQGTLITFFINMTFLFAAVALLITDSKASIGMKIIFVIGDLIPELVAALITCWYGQKIIDSTEDLCYTVYQMRWYDLKPQDRKQLVTIMIRTQNPMNLSGGGIKVFNLEAYTEMLSTAYSYTNVLGAIKQP